MPPIGMKPFVPQGATSDFGFGGVLDTEPDPALTERDPLTVLRDRIFSQAIQSPERQALLQDNESALFQNLAQYEQVQKIEFGPKSKTARRLGVIFGVVPGRAQQEAIKSSLAEPLLRNITSLMRERRLLTQPSKLDEQVMKAAFEQFDSMVGQSKRQELLEGIMRDPQMAKAVNSIMAQAYLVGETKFENIIKDEDAILKDELASKGYDLGLKLSGRDPASRDDFFGIAKDILDPRMFGMAQVIAASSESGKKFTITTAAEGETGEEFEDLTTLIDTFDAAAFQKFQELGRVDRERSSISWLATSSIISGDRTRGDIATNRTDWIRANAEVYRQRFDRGGTAGALLFERFDDDIKSAIMGSTSSSDVLGIADEAERKARERAGAAASTRPASQ